MLLIKFILRKFFKAVSDESFVLVEVRSILSGVPVPTDMRQMIVSTKGILS